MKNNSLKDEISSRINVLCSDLRNFRADFIRGAVVFGSCQAKNIPDEFKPKDKDLPNNMECRLRISFGNNQHKFRFSKFTGQETYDWLINNTGLEDYINMLGDIWPEGGYSWLVEKPEYIELLNQKADHIYELSEPLLREKEYRDIANKVRAIAKRNGGRWTVRSSVNCSYPEEIKKAVEEIKSPVAQKPAEPEQKATPAKWWGIPTCLRKILEEGWQIFTKSFWDSVFDRCWPK